MSNKNDNNKTKSYVGLGIVMGAAIGLALDNMIMGAGAGIVFGISIDRIRNSKKSNKK